MEIIGRTQEIGYLEALYTKDVSSTLVLYGERFLGKEALLRQFAGEEPYSRSGISDKPFLILRALPVSGREQAAIWGKLLRSSGVGLPEYPTYAELFAGIEKYFNGAKALLAILDFEHLFRTSGKEFADEFFAAFQAVSSRFTLCTLLVSSHIAFVENHLLEALGENVRNVTEVMRIKPLAFNELRAYFADRSAEECLCLYAIFGGYPGLWAYYDRKLEFSENMYRLFFAERAPLAEPEQFYIAPYLREPAVYHTLLYCLAKESGGVRKLNDLYAETGFSRAKISVYLKNLAEIGVVEKTSSFSVSQDLQLKGAYTVSVPLLLFRFAKTFGRDTAPGGVRELFLEIYPTLRAFSEGAYRRACAEYLNDASAKGALPLSLKESGYWLGKNGTLDFIGRAADGQFLVASCCLDKDGYAEERLNGFLFTMQEAGVTPSYLYFFSMHGFMQKALERLSGIDGIYLMDDTLWQKRSL